MGLTAQITWLVTAITLTGFFWAGFFWAGPELPELRPGYWSMRFMLIQDTRHALSPGRSS